ncbi:MAG: hypothetical protein ACRDMV_03235 [Streptosporangiales bacterium]
MFDTVADPEPTVGEDPRVAACAALLVGRRYRGQAHDYNDRDP